MRWQWVRLVVVVSCALWRGSARVTCASTFTVLPRPTTIIVETHPTYSLFAREGRHLENLLAAPRAQGLLNDLLFLLFFFFFFFFFFFCFCSLWDCCLERAGQALGDVFQPAAASRVLPLPLVFFFFFFFFLADTKPNHQRGRG